LDASLAKFLMETELPIWTKPRMDVALLRRLYERSDKLLPRLINAKTLVEHPIVERVDPPTDMLDDNLA
jgi:hypothetical protein